MAVILDHNVAFVPYCNIQKLTWQKNTATDACIISNTTENRAPMEGRVYFVLSKAADRVKS